MKNLLKTNIDRLRIIGFIEGLSLLTLIFIAMPLKYLAHDPSWVKIIGPVHGTLFLLFIINTLSVSIEQRWKFSRTTWKVLLACIIPFGTFYINNKILSAIPLNKAKQLVVIFLFVITTSCSNGPTNSFSKNNMVFPESLAELKIYREPMARLAPENDVQVLELSSTLFTDYAEKQRLLKLPSGSKLTANNDKLPHFPDGTILAKTFYYTASQTQGKQKIIETRILIRNKGIWNVANYIWNDTQTNAFLSYEGITVPVSITAPSAKRLDINYKVPGVYDCFDCHRDNNEIMPLGPKLRNLNRNIVVNDSIVSQLEYLQRKGLLEITGHQSISRLPPYADKGLPIQERARAYFEINCAHCHNPDGFAGGYSLNLLYETDFKNTGININNWNIEHRMTIRDMPKLGTTIVDQEGLKLIQQYLASLKKS